MSSFIKEVRSDGLYLLDLAITDHRIRTIAAFISRYSVANVMAVSAGSMDKGQQENLQKPSEHFLQWADLSLEVLLTQCFGHTKSLTCSLLLTLRPITSLREAVGSEFQSLLFAMQITIYVT